MVLENGVEKENWFIPAILSIAKKANSKINSIFSIGAKFEAAIPIKAETRETQFTADGAKSRLTLLGHVE